MKCTTSLLDQIIEITINEESKTFLPFDAYSLPSRFISLKTFLPLGKFIAKGGYIKISTPFLKLI